MIATGFYMIATSFRNELNRDVMIWWYAYIIQVNIPVVCEEKGEMMGDQNIKLGQMSI